MSKIKMAPGTDFQYRKQEKKRKTSKRIQLRRTLVQNLSN